MIKISTNTQSMHQVSTTIENIQKNNEMSSDAGVCECLRMQIIQLTEEDLTDSLLYLHSKQSSPMDTQLSKYQMSF